MEKTYFKTIVGPWSKLELTTLIIKWKPGYVNFARAFENSRWNIEHGSVCWSHNIRLKSSIESFISTEKKFYTSQKAFWPINHCRCLLNSSAIYQPNHFLLDARILLYSTCLLLNQKQVNPKDIPIHDSLIPSHQKQMLRCRMQRKTILCKKLSWYDSFQYSKKSI